MSRQTASRTRTSRRGWGDVSYTEEKILRAFGQLPLATAEAITRLLFKKGSKAYVRRVMTRLAGGADQQKNQYLYRFGMPHAPGNFERLYTLGRRGRDFLRERGVGVHWCYRPRSPYSFSFLQHHLAVTHFIVALHAFCRISPDVQVTETRHGFAMAESPPTFTLSADDGATTITVLPDAWVSLERAHTESSEIQDFFLWIEVDCGTEAKAKFQQLVRERINFFRCKGYEAYFGTSSVLFCYLAVGSTTELRINRLHTMRQWTAQVLAELELADWAAVFRFSTIDECLYDTLMLFTDPVWYLPDADTLVPLFTPPQEQEEADDNSEATHLS